MQYTQLGKTDLNVSRIGFGCWQLTPQFWGEVEIGPWQQAIDRAVDTGLNFIDTANAYGEGYAETCLGDYLAATGLRDKFVLATKFYWNFEREPRYPDTRHDQIIKECEASLKRLKTDRIDLYQIHAWDPLTRPAEVAAALRQLRQEGKVRWFGVSNLNVEQMRMYLKHFDIECLQPLYNLIDREIEADELPFCLGERIGVIPYSPLYRGLLTGKYERDHKFTDSRARLPLCNGAAFQRMLDALDELRPVAESFGLSVAQLAIRWILTHPAVSSAIVGIKTPDHVETIVQAADDVLPPEAWHQVAKVVARAKSEALS